MRVLKYENRKCPEQLFDISTPEKEAAAYLRLFKELDGYWQCYADLAEVEKPVLCEPCQAKLHKHCAGCCSCIETEECKRKNREYRQENLVNRMQRPLYLKAKAGDVDAIKKLMKARSNYEYEEVRHQRVRNFHFPEEEEVDA